MKPYSAKNFLIKPKTIEMDIGNPNLPYATVGYSGHAFVAIDVFQSKGIIISVYTDFEEKQKNPFHLKYLGNDHDEKVIEMLKSYNYFIAVGENKIRRTITEKLIKTLPSPINAIHLNATIASHVKMGFGVMVAAGATINPFVKIGNGAICNTQCSIDHECVIGDYTHIAPGAVLCGNVHVGENSFIGANSVIKQGVCISKNVIIGAGSVVLKDILESGIYAGNPAKKINKS
jgi:sugar O-acyltransferase (sialic acid O-acetyltransferase NeuD family)